MSFKPLLFTTLLFMHSVIAFTQQYYVVTYNATNTPAFATNEFSSIAVGKDGAVWAGTQQKGLYKLSGGSWEKGSLLSGVLINDIKTDSYGGIWVAQSGDGSLSANGGGVNYFADARFDNTIFYDKYSGLPTNYTRGVFIDTASKLSLPLVWVSTVFTHNILGYSGGGLGKGIRNSSVAFATITNGVYNENNTGACRTIGGNDKEVWVFASDNARTPESQLLTYNTQTGTFNGYYDYIKVPQLTRDFLAKTIFIDKQNRVWIGMDDGALVVFDGSTWHRLDLSKAYKASTSVNAITADKDGVIYIGTSNGLLIYRQGDVASFTSYTTPSPVNQLPVANIKSLYCDGYATWLATDQGVLKLGVIDFSAYTQENRTSNDINNSDLLSHADKKGYISVNVAADNSFATLLVFAGVNARDMELTITGHPDVHTAYSPDYGQFNELRRTDDSLIYVYHHPQYVRNGKDSKSVAYPISLTNKIDKSVVITGLINVYHAPVLMIHGVWSTIYAFDPLSRYLLNNTNNYNRYQLLVKKYVSLQHTEPVDASLKDASWIPDGINELLKECRKNGLSSGKVNIVAHSRGGMYARYYLQENYLKYNNDIKSLITINTPHSGSQSANLALDNRAVFIKATLGDATQAFALGEDDDPNGAYELKINSPTILEKLNGYQFLNKNKVPSHAITSTYKFGITNGDILKTIFVNGATILAGPWGVGIRTIVMALGTGCVEEFRDECIAEVFNGEASDIVVPLSSQEGGLEEKAITHFEGYAHTEKKFYYATEIIAPGILNVDDTKYEVIKLLRQNPFSSESNFSLNGFHPKKLEYNFLKNLPGNPDGLLAGQADSIVINPSVKSGVFVYGDTVDVDTKSSADVRKLLIVYKGDGLQQVYSDIWNDGNHVFKFPVPKQALGKITIQVYGFNGNGPVTMDSSYFNVLLRPGIRLDSIKIQPTFNDKLALYAADSIKVTVLGYFNDTARDIAYLPGISYRLEKANIARLLPPNYLKGILPDTDDILHVSYLGKTDSIIVQVEDSIFTSTTITLPLSFTYFNAEYDKLVTLRWVAANEFNNKQFEIEYSRNGLNFTKIGTTPAGTTVGQNYYMYNTAVFNEGRNFYRLKQVDKDGHFTYSAIRLINIGSLPGIVIFPNPASRQITVQLKQPAVTQMALTIINMQGVKVFTKVINNSSGDIRVTLPDLSKGVYLVRVETGAKEQSTTQKLIIN